MDPTTRSAIERNLFPIARTIIDERPNFPWHRDEQNRYTAAFPNSSQALAVDVIWTIRALASRDRILDAWCHGLGLPFSGPWNIELEELVPHEALGEPRRTQIDAVARSPNGVLVIECKFTEEDGGSCSQWKPLSGRTANAGLVQCNGNYEPQVNPVNGRTSRCALTGKGIRYWEIVPKVLNIDADAAYRPCPFKGGWYQWMRNLVVASEMGRASALPAAFVVVYADGPFPMAQKIAKAEADRSCDWAKLSQLTEGGSIPLRTLSYQMLLCMARDIAAARDSQTIRQLADWVNTKMEQSSPP